MSKIEAIVVADSTNPQNDRLTSVLVTMPRIILSEMNTHRMLSKNTSSSRAIPFNKMVESVQNDPFIPIAWQKHHSGMQGNEYLTDRKHENAVYEWLKSRDYAVKQAKMMNNDGVTKQLCNRLLEPFMWTTMLITGSKEGWENFFSLRCPQYSFGSNTTTPKIWKSRKDAVKDFPDWISRNDFYWNTINKGQAEIHMMMLSEKIYDVIQESVPKKLKENEWHIPMSEDLDDNLSIEEKVKYSVGRAANTSYTVIGDGSKLSLEQSIKIHDKCKEMNHSSVFEHCARVMSNEEYASFIKGNLDVEIDADGYIDISTHINNYNSFGWCRNFKGFIQYRHTIEKIL